MEVKPGMVLKKSAKWVGISDAEAARLQKAGKRVEVKEGIRFGLVFFLTLAVTMLFGNLFFYIAGL